MKAIIFDFDGVIADTYNFNMALTKEVGHDVDHESFKAHHDGNVFKKPKIPFTQESADSFFSQYSDKITNVEAFFSLKDIKVLRKICPLYIISSSKEESIEKFLNHNQLDYFEEILGVDFHKSKVEKFKYLFEKYNYDPSEVIFISDTLGDILEAREVDVKTIAVDFGFHDRARLEKGKPFKIVSNFAELLDTIKNIED